MRNVYPLLPRLTVNRRFMADFIAASAPCLALGLVEEHGKECGFLGIRPDVEIPDDITAKGFRFGHQLLGSKDVEAILFTFEFYGFGRYNCLINPNNEVVRSVLRMMVASGDYFFFAINPSQGVTVFRSQLAAQDLAGLKTNLPAIEASKTTGAHYLKLVARFCKTAEPAGTLLKWVCQDGLEYLDLRNDRLELTPAARQ